MRGGQCKLFPSCFLLLFIFHVLFQRGTGVLEGKKGGVNCCYFSHLHITGLSFSSALRCLLPSARFLTTSPALSKLTSKRFLTFSKVSYQFLKLNKDALNFSATIQSWVCVTVLSYFTFESEFWKLAFLRAITLGHGTPNFSALFSALWYPGNLESSLKWWKENTDLTDFIIRSSPTLKCFSASSVWS